MKDDKNKRYIVAHRVTLAGVPRKPKAEGNFEPLEKPDINMASNTPPEDEIKDPGLFEKPGFKNTVAPGRKPVTQGEWDEDQPRKSSFNKADGREPRQREWDDEPVTPRRREPRGSGTVPAWSLILLFALIAVLAAISLYFFVLKSEGTITPEPSGTPTATVEPTPSPTPVPTPSPTPVPTPSPTPDPYFTVEEQVVSDADAGHWSYSSPTLWVDINRIYDESLKVTYLAAEVRVKPDSGETERGGFAVPGDPNAKNVKLNVIARSYKAVVAISGDFLKDNIQDDPKGVIIRDGIVCVDHDDADTAAFMPDGTIKIYKAGEVTADELTAEGVKNSFSFGPTLINNDVIADGLDKAKLHPKNPRTAIGMIEPYHYLLVVVQGRSPEPTNGMTFSELAGLFASYNCTVAYNLDGGQSATMAFMGEHISKYGGSLTKQRPVPDALMFGKSDLVTPSE